MSDVINLVIFTKHESKYKTNSDKWYLLGYKEAWFSELWTQCTMRSNIIYFTQEAMLRCLTIGNDFKNLYYIYNLWLS
jgi:hypothetical protein